MLALDFYYFDVEALGVVGGSLDRFEHWFASASGLGFPRELMS